MSTGIWDVIIPEAGTNLALNPTAAITGNLTAIGATAGTAVSRVTTYTYLGPGCHRITSSTNNEGGYFTLKAAANAIHYCTMRIHTSSDIDAFDVSMDNANWHNMTLLATEGSWWVYGVQIPAAQANASTAFRVQQNGAGSIDLYIGHVQVEQNTYATTPITGDLLGTLNLLDNRLPPGYKWEGSPNASASVRNSQERTGGKVVDVEDTYSVRVRWANGVGMAPVQHQTQGYALLPGMQFLGQKINPRVIDITAVMGQSITPAATHTVRKKLVDAIKLDRVAGSQPVIMRYRGALSTKPVEFRCYYDTGMDLNKASKDFDQPAVRLIAYDPYAYEVGTASAQLTTTQDIANADFAVKRLDGVWSTISTNFADDVRCFAKAHDGCIYIGGEFLNVGDANGDGVVKYDPVAGTITSLGSGVSGGNHQVLSMAVAPNGDLYIAGDFLDAGGVANADFCACWDVSAGAWVALSATLLSAYAWAVVIGQDGKVYFGGTFDNVAAGTTDKVVSYTPSSGAWAAMGDGLNGSVYGMALAPNGNIYATGAFTASGAVTIDEQVAVWNGTAWAPVGDGAMSGGSDWGTRVTVDSAGHVYLGGDFTAVGGVTTNNLAMFDGAQWLALGSPNGSIDALKWIDGLLYAGGAFNTIGGLSTGAAYFAVYNGYTWTLAPVSLPGTPIVHDIFKDDENLYIGFNDTGTATSAYLNTVTNSGTARAYPVVHIKREGGTSASVQWLKNETTGSVIYLDYDLLDGEELVLDFRLGQRRVYSSFFGDVWRAVLRGSQFTEFYLQPGANSISAYVAQVGPPTMTQYMEWVTTHEGADGAAA